MFKTLKVSAHTCIFSQLKGLTFHHPAVHFIGSYYRDKVLNLKFNTFVIYIQPESRVAGKV